MSGHKSFKILRDQIDTNPERRARVEKLERLYDAVLALSELRAARGVTQAELAQALEVSQANISRLEHSQDLYLSTLARYVAALGGHLELKAVFSDETVELALPGAE